MIGRELAGYRIEAQIGQGEIGVVYRALDLELSKPVALKLLRVDALGPSQLPQFEEQAWSLSALVHPNIVAILDCGVSDAIPFVAMELLEGQTLAEALGPGPFAPARARKVASELLSALAYVHGRGLTHGDLKPGNIFLQRLPDGTEQTKLLDFGLVKSSGVVAASADVHSAAAACFAMLSGAKPLASNGDPPLVHEVCADRVARPELERALQQALSSRTSDRQPSAVELERQLSAVPEPWLYEGREATKERRKAALAVRSALRRTTAAAQRDAAANARSKKATPVRAGMTAERAHKLAVIGAWLLSIVALAVIGITATMFYLSSDSADPEARKAFERALSNEPARAPDAAPPADASLAPELASPAEPVERVEPLAARAPRVPAQNPWSAPLPRELRGMRWKIEIGQEGDREMLKDLKRYVRRYPKDPRGPLLLARLYANRDAWNDAITYYKLAFERDPSSRGDPRMLKDLVSAVARTESSWRASELIPVIYGREAVIEIKRVIARTHDNEERLRLEQLAHTLAP